MMQVFSSLGSGIYSCSTVIDCCACYIQLTITSGARKVENLDGGCSKSIFKSEITSSSIVMIKPSWLLML